ncbi:MAG: hypothetical protein PQJ46_03070 [Spirochaetales bacterium]|nr:hypothetical protein [Spirochaetales bacterium]
MRIGKYPGSIGSLLIVLLFVSCRTVPQQLFRSDLELETVSIESVGTPIVYKEVSPDFLGFCIDSSQIFGGKWWEGSDVCVAGVGGAEASELDLQSGNLVKLTGELGNSVLRIGGSEADKLYYDIQNKGEKPEGYDLSLTKKRWKEIIDFCKLSNLKLLFTINAGPGSRLDKKGRKSEWQPDNARSLIKFAHDTNSPVFGWEYGNEPNGFSFIHGHRWKMTGSEYANGFNSFYDMVKDINPSYQVVGPAIAHWPVIGEFANLSKDFFRKIKNIDEITFHYYPQQSRRGAVRTRTARHDTMLSERNLDDVLNVIEHYKEIQADKFTNVPLWIGETGNAQFGGEPGVSDTFLSSLWFMDLLCLSATNGIERVMRQTLIGSDYGLIDSETTQPRPDYYTALLWKRMIKGYPVSVQYYVSGNEDQQRDGIRIYSFADYKDDEINLTFVVINLNTDKEFKINMPVKYGRSRFVIAKPVPGDVSKVLWNNIPPRLPVQDENILIPYDNFSNKGIVLPPISYAVIKAYEI